MASAPTNLILKPGRSQLFTVSQINDDGGSVQLQVDSIDVTTIFEEGDSLTVDFAATYTDGDYTLNTATFSTNSLLTIALTYSASTTGTVTIPDSTIIGRYVDFTAALDAARLTGFFRQAQELDLREQVGDDFYEDFINTQAGAATPSTAYRILCGYLYPAVTWFAYSRFILFGDVNASRNGARLFDDQFSTPLDARRMQQQANEARSTALQYIRRMEAFIDDNSSNYTDWNPKTGRSQSPLGFVAV